MTREIRRADCHSPAWQIWAGESDTWLGWGTSRFMAEAPVAAATPPPGPHFLESEWVIWEHRAPDKTCKVWEENMERVCELATVEDFWSAWNAIPKPSQIFYDGRTKKKFKDRTIESFSLFKKNIKPEWEDPLNRTGAEWFCRKQARLCACALPALPRCHPVSTAVPSVRSSRCSSSMSSGST